MKKNKKIQTVSFVLSVFVIFIHSYNINNYPELNETIVYMLENIISNGIAWLAVPLFFLISGFLFFQGFSKDVITRKFKNRIRGLLIPYVLWNTLYMLVFLILTNLPYTTSFLSTDTVKLTPLNLLQGIFLYRYNLFFWYIYQLMIYIILSPLLNYLIRNRTCCLITLFIIYTLSVFFQEIPFFNGYGLMSTYLMFYLIGAFLSLHYPRFINETKQISRSLSWSIFIILIIIRIIIMSTEKRSYCINALYNLDYVASVLTLWVVLDCTEKLNEVHISSYSFFIYAFHPLIAGTFSKLYSVYLPHTKINAIINYLLTVWLSLAISVIVGRLAKKHCYAIYKLLSGGR